MADAPAEPASTTGQPYQVLARKYRSRTFDEVVGQEPVARTLKKAIETGRVHHAYLFCGTRGVGKTSMARILALALNDPTSDAATESPDPTTETADAIFKGDDVDVIEIDAASNTGVDNVRDLIENARFRPMRSRFKVYIIDEVHMLSKAAFNALLKIMEEPPSHVKFILATTEPERVLPTILSRVQRFDFRNIPAADIVGHLRAVVEGEGRKAKDDALALVARNGQGSMRDSLSLLDRLLGGLDPTDELTVEDVTRLLGLPPRERVSEVVDAIADGDAKAAMTLADAIVSSGLAADAFVGSLVEHLHALLIRGVVGPDNEAADLPGLDSARLDAQNEAMDQAGLTQAVAILEELRRQMRSGGGTGRALLDATLVRLALARQFTPVADLLAAAGGRGGGGADPKKASRPANAGPRRPTAEPPRAPAPPPEPERPPAAEAKPDAAPPPAAAPMPPAKPRPPSSADSELIDRLRITIERDNDTVAPLLAGARAEREGGRVRIIYPHEQGMFAGMLERGNKREIVMAALREVLGLEEDPGVTFEVDEAPPEPEPTEEELAPKRPRIKKPPIPTNPSPMPTPNDAPPSEADLQADPLVQAAIRELGARVVKIEDA